MLRLRVQGDSLIWATEYIVLCEAMHWFFGFVLAVPVFLLIWIILPEDVRYTKRVFWSGQAAFWSALVTHVLLDYIQWGW
jgi:hypothetical protein